MAGINPPHLVGPKKRHRDWTRRLIFCRWIWNDFGIGNAQNIRLWYSHDIPNIQAPWLLVQSPPFIPRNLTKSLECWVFQSSPNYQVQLRLKPLKLTNGIRFKEQSTPVERASVDVEQSGKWKNATKARWKWECCEIFMAMSRGTYFRVHTYRTMAMKPTTWWYLLDYHACMPTIWCGCVWT